MGQTLASRQGAGQDEVDYKYEKLKVGSSRSILLCFFFTISIKQTRHSKNPSHLSHCLTDPICIAEPPILDGKKSQHGTNWLNRRPGYETKGLCL